MTDSIIGCVLVKEDENSKQTRISGHKEVNGDFYECGFSARED